MFELVFSFPPVNKEMFISIVLQTRMRASGVWITIVRADQTNAIYSKKNFTKKLLGDSYCPVSTYYGGIYNCRAFLNKTTNKAAYGQM